VKDEVDHVVLARSMSMPSFRACASQLVIYHHLKLVSLSLLFYLSLSLSLITVVHDREGVHGGYVAAGRWGVGCVEALVNTYLI
jgi:hypothetical protein